MNEICEKLYSNKNKGITARSVNLEDMEKWLTDEGKKAKNDFIRNRVKNELTVNDYIESKDEDNNTVTYKKEKSYYPVLWKVQSNESENYYTEETLIKDDEQSYDQEESNLTVKQTYYEIPINIDNYGEGSKVLSNSSYYWGASRFVVAYLEKAGFGLHRALTKIYGSDMFRSNSDKCYDHGHLRAVVSLRSDIKVTPASGANGENNPHKINWK